jgi:acyl carrier protein
MRDTEAWLVGALRRRAPRFPGPITDATSITDEGLCLDSLALMDLLSEIEAVLSVVLRDDDIHPANMGTVGQLLRTNLDGRRGREGERTHLIEPVEHREDELVLDDGGCRTSGRARIAEQRQPPRAQGHARVAPGTGFKGVQAQ